MEIPRTIVFAIVLCASLVASVALADQPETSPSFRLALDLSDGSHVLGTVNIASIRVRTPYAKIDIPLEQILSVMIEEHGEKASLELRNGDRLTGVLDLQAIELKTLFGTVAIQLGHITGIQQTGRALPASAEKGLVLHYSFDEKPRDNKATDYSPGGNHGTVHGAQWTAKGKVGGAYRFDGRDDFITADDSSSLDIQHEVTVMAWIKPRKLDSRQVFVAKTAGGDNTWLVEINPIDFALGKMNFYLYTGGAEANFGSSQRITTSWHHIAVVYDSTEKRIYLDGKLDSVLPFSGTILLNDQPLTVGDWASKDRPFGGLIDEVIVWRRALSEAEVKQIYHFQEGTEGK